MLPGRHRWDIDAVCIGLLSQATAFRGYRNFRMTRIFQELFGALDIRLHSY